MDDTKKKGGGSSVPPNDSLPTTLTRLGQTVRARNNAGSRNEKAEQVELPLDFVSSIDEVRIENFGAFENNMLSEQDILDNCNTPTDHVPLDSLDYLRDAHRLLSEQIIAANRKLAQVAKLNNIDSLEVSAVRKRLTALQAQRAGLNTIIEDWLKTIKTQQRTESHTVPQEADDHGQGGLVKVRHPNRDFFLADMFDYALKDDGASMEAPIFTLATKPDLSIWEWSSRDGNRTVKVTPSVLGRATQHDKDILIYVVSQMTEGMNRGRDDTKNRTIRFTVYDLLIATNRDTSGRGYKLLHETFERLRGTSITTDIRTGGQRVREGFGIIDRWKIIEKSPTDERMVAVEVTLSEWLYNAVQAYEVLTIHPDYFRLRKPLARRLYELARKHCGHQSQWKIGLDLLQAKAGSKSSLREFRRAVHTIEADNSLPEYSCIINDDDTVIFRTRDAKRLLISIDKRP